jgi:CheY-like chemotaxis protein
MATTAKLLIIDDNDMNRDLLARRLKQAFYDVIDVNNGVDALKLVEEGGIDLVLLDILMPGMDGYEVLEKLKKGETTKSIPVIMLTAVHEMDSVVRCFELGADDYLTKPYNIPFVKSRIATCLRGRMLNESGTGDLARILVVDDNSVNRDMLQRRLEREGYSVDTAENGIQALEAMGKQSYSLVLLDILMPEMDGYDVLRTMKNTEKFKNIPVIMLTAVHEAESVRSCIDLGAADYLLKPYNTILLKARIASALS